MAERADRIAIHGLRAHAHHGVYRREREVGQIFLVDAVLEVDTRPAAADDDLGRTVNYAELAQRLHAGLVSEPVDLLESLAQRLADICLAHPLVDAVEITVHKPQADLGVPFDDVTVTIHRGRPHPSPRPPSAPPAPGAARGADGEAGPR